MLWFLLAPPAIFFIFKNLYFGFTRPDSFIEWMMVTFIGLVFSAVILGVCAGAAALTGFAFASHAVEVRTESLAAIRDKDGVQGQFFLGSGIIKSDQYYFYYAKSDDGGFRPGKIFVGQGVRVYEEDRQDAKLTTFEWVVDAPLAAWVAFPVNSGGYSYNFHVPKGTIRTGYSM